MTTATYDQANVRYDSLVVFFDGLLSTPTEMHGPSSDATGYIVRTAPTPVMKA